MTDFEGCLSPTFSSFCRLFIGQALKSIPHETINGCFKVNDWIFRNVQFCGTVMSVTEREKLVSVLLDDGTGVIKCVIWKQSRYDPYQQAENNLESKLRKLARTDPEVLECGKSYIIRGRLRLYNGSLEMNTFSYCKLESFVDEVEMVCSNETIHELYNSFSQVSRSEVLDVPILEIVRLLRSNDNVGCLSSFTIRDLYFNDEIVAILRNYFIPKSQMNSLLQSSVSVLLDTGEAFIDDFEHDQSARKYCLVKMGSAVYSDVFKVVKNGKDGVHCNDILKLLKTKVNYKDLTQKVVKRVLDDLESQSQIYQIEKCVYSTL